MQEAEWSVGGRNRKTRGLPDSKCAGRRQQQYASDEEASSSHKDQRISARASLADRTAPNYSTAQVVRGAAVACGRRGLTASGRLGVVWAWPSPLWAITGSLRASVPLSPSSALRPRPAGLHLPSSHSPKPGVCCALPFSSSHTALHPPPQPAAAAARATLTPDAAPRHSILWVFARADWARPTLSPRSASQLPDFHPLRAADPDSPPLPAAHCRRHT